MTIKAISSIYIFANTEVLILADHRKVISTTADNCLFLETLLPQLINTITIVRWVRCTPHHATKRTPPPLPPPPKRRRTRTTTHSLARI